MHSLVGNSAPANRSPLTAHRSPLTHLKNHLSRLARLYRVDRSVRFTQRKTMRNDRRRIEFAGAQKASHLMPGFVHPPPHHAVDRQPFEDDFGSKVEVHFL